jgi:hypothetical protein
MEKRFKEPQDTANMVELANGVQDKLVRGLTWLHMPVPENRSDDAYFSPLTSLQCSSTTEVYLGLVHGSDGALGTQKRIDVASRYLSEFGVAAECGMGRCAAETIPGLFQIHADAADPILDV